MVKHRFSSTDQPTHRGVRHVDPDKKAVHFMLTLTPEVRDWYQRRKGLARKVLEEYRKSEIEKAL